MTSPIHITALDIEARGIGHWPNEDGTDGKVVFVDGALPGEIVSVQTYRKKANWDSATITHLHHESPQRVQPKCPHFGVCGGCSMQHLASDAQVAIKQRVLEDNLWHIGKVKANTLLPPIHGPSWGYRYRARLSVRHVIKKGAVLVGFHEKKSRYVADIKTCDILPPHVSAMLMPLRALIAQLSLINDIPQIELAVGEQVTAMVLRIMKPLTTEDEALLEEFADRHHVQWWLQPKGLDSVTLFYPALSSNLSPASGRERRNESLCDFPVREPQLHYSLAEFGVTIPFKPIDFTQVNAQMNRVMVTKAIRLLDVKSHERVADWFCGLGNFTLALATQAREVVGIEGSDSLVKRAIDNAIVNGLSHKTHFYVQNLFELTANALLKLGQFDRYLIDPPRDGAMALCEALVHIAASAPEFLPRTIVYVSCSPSTLARDAGILVNAGYVLEGAGIMNMFPHTSHVESMAVFVADVRLEKRD